jgi:thioredoxin-like negative regulator of GroEL
MTYDEALRELLEVVRKRANQHDRTTQDALIDMQHMLDIEDENLEVPE